MKFTLEIYVSNYFRRKYISLITYIEFNINKFHYLGRGSNQYQNNR